MALKTLSTLRADVRSHLDESTARQWTDAEIDRWINEGARDVARRGEVLQDRGTITVTANTQEYTMPTNLIRVSRVEFTRTGDTSVYPLEYRDFNSMDAVWWSGQTSARGTPYWYTLWGFPPTLKVVLYPTPSSAGTLKVFYYRLPAEASLGTDPIEIPEGWFDLVVLYCEYVALRKDADQRWAEAKAIYEEKVGEIIDVTRRWTDQADAIQVSGSMIPAWLYDSGY